MYAVIKTGGKQYKVAAGEKLKIEQIAADVGQEIVIDQVLAVGNGNDLQVGTPLVAGAVVKATVLAQGRHDKVRIFKMRRRKHYQKRQGHRQNFTEVVILGLEAGGQKTAAEPARVEFARKRAAAWAVRHTPSGRPVTRAEKIAQGIEKPAKVKKNSLRKGN